MTEGTPEMMKALALGDKGGATNEIEIARPKPDASSGGDDELAVVEVLVEVAYSALDTSFDSLANRDMASGYVHDMKSKPIVVGYHFSGRIVEIGGERTTSSKDDGATKTAAFDVGNLVFGHLQYEPTQRQGAYSEFITVSQDSIALVPSSGNKVSLEQAAASTTEALTALQAMRDLGGLQEGMSVLILGAGGGVGSLAVEIAKALGATNVTAVCSTKDVNRVRRLGADHVVDRSKQAQELNSASMHDKFDVVFDVPSKYSFARQGMKWLKPGGTFVTTLPTFETLALGWFWPIITKKRLKTVLVVSKKADLELIGSWMADGRLTVDVDSVYNISDFDSARQRQDDCARTGRVVIKVKDGW